MKEKEKINKKIAESKKKRKKELKKIDKEKRVSLRDFAFYLKHNQTPMETSLWIDLLSKRPEHFERQAIIDNKFIVDFCYRKLKFVIEIDGSSHDFKYEYDIDRENYLLNNGYYIIRFTEEELRRNPHGAFDDIAHILKYLTVLYNHNMLFKTKGRKFEYSPWFYGIPEEFKKFSLEEQKMPDNCFEEF